MLGYRLTIDIADFSIIVERCITIPSDITFGKLHEIIQILFSIEKQEGYYFEFTNPEIIIKETGSLNSDNIDVRREKLDKYFEAYTKVTYYAQQWKIRINIEVTNYDKDYPTIHKIRCNYNPGRKAMTIKEYEEELNSIGMHNKTIRNDSLEKINKFTLQKNLLDIFNKNYRINHKKIIINKLNDKSTLEKYI